MNFMGENTKVPKRWMDIDNMPFEHLLYMKYRQKGSDELHFLLKNSPVVGFDVKCQLCKKLFKVSELRAHFSTVKHLKKMNEVAELHYNQEERIMQLIARDNASQTTRSRMRYASSIFEEVQTKDEPRSSSSQTLENGDNTDAVTGQGTIKVGHTTKNSHNSTKQIKKLWPPTFNMEDCNKQSCCSKKSIKEKNAVTESCSAAHVLNLYMDFWPQNNLPQKALYEFSNYEKWRKEKVKANECHEDILSARDSKVLGQGKPKTSYHTDEMDDISVLSYDINLHSLENQHKINPAENEKTQAVQTCNVVTETLPTPAANIPKCPTLGSENINQLQCCPQKSIKEKNAVIEPCSSLHFLNLYLDFRPQSNVYQNALHEFGNYEKWRKEKVRTNGCVDVVLSLCEGSPKLSYDTDEKDDTLVPSVDITSPSLEHQHTVNAAENDIKEAIEICNEVTEKSQTPAANIPKCPVLGKEDSNQLQFYHQKSIKENNAVTEPFSSVHFLNLYMDFWPQSNLYQNPQSDLENNKKWQKEKAKSNGFDEVVLSPCEFQFFSQGQPKLSCDTDEKDETLVPSIDITPHSPKNQHTINDAENDKMEVVQTCNELPQTFQKPKLSCDTDEIDETLVPSVDITPHFLKNQHTSDAENEKMEVVLTCNELPQTPQKPKLSCETDKIDDTLLPSTDITPRSLENQHTITDAENDKMEVVQTCNEPPQPPQKPKFSCETDKIDDTLVPSTDITPHFLENQHTKKDVEIDRMKVVQTCNEIPPTTATKIKNRILNQRKPKLSCDTNRIDDNLVPSIDTMPHSPVNQHTNEVETKKMEIVQSSTGIPPTTVSKIRNRILSQEKPKLSCDTDKIDDTLVPSIDIMSHSREKQKINKAETDRMEVVQTCNEIPQTTASKIKTHIHSQRKPKLSCNTDKIDDTLVPSIDKMPYSRENKQTINDETDRMEVVQTCNEIPQTIASIIKTRIRNQGNPQLSCDTYKKDDTLVPSIKITPHSLQTHHTINDAVTDRMEVGQTCNEIPQTTAANIPKHVYNMLQLRDLLKIKFRTKNTAFRPMFSRDTNTNAVICHICSNNYTLHTKAHAVKHILEGEVHIRKMNQKVVEIYHPECSWLQFSNGMSMHENFVDLVAFLADPPSNSLEEFVEAMKQPFDNLLKVVILEPSGEWNSMLTYENNLFSCNLCKRMQLSNESEVKEHCQSMSHMENGKFMLQSYGNSSSDPKLIEQDQKKLNQQSDMQSSPNSKNRDSKIKQFMSKCADMTIDELLNIQLRTADEEDLYMITKNKKQYTCNLCRTFTTAKVKEIGSHLVSGIHLASINNVKELKHPEYFGLIKSSVETNLEKILPVDYVKGNNDSWKPIAKKVTVKAEAIPDCVFSSLNENDKKWFSELTSANKEKIEISPGHKQVLEQFMLKCVEMHINEILKIKYRTADEDDLYMIKKIPNTNFFVCCPCKIRPSGNAKHLKAHLLSDNHLDSIHNVKEFKHPAYYELLESSVETNVEKILPLEVLASANDIWEPIAENSAVEAVPYSLALPSKEKHEKRSCEVHKYNEKMKRNAKMVPKAKNQNPLGAMDLKEFRRTYRKMTLKNLLEIQYRKKPADWQHMLKIVDGQYYCNLCGGEFLGNRKNLQSHINGKSHSTSLFSVKNLYHPTSLPDAILYTPKPKSASIEEYVNGVRLTTQPDAEGPNAVESETSNNSTSCTKSPQQNSQNKSSDIVVASPENNSKTLTIKAFKLSYINLPAEELMKIEYKKTPSSDWNFMIHENPVQYRCNLCCRIKLKDAENVVSHLNSKLHIQNMESIKGMYNPRHYSNGSLSNKGNSADLKSAKRLEEFKLKYAEMELDAILKVQFKTSGNTWQYMIENEEIRYLCILCWRISLKTKDDISSHVRNSSHHDNMKEVADLHHPVCFPSKVTFEKTKLPTEKKFDKNAKQVKTVNFAPQTLSSNAKSIGSIASDAKGVSDDSKSSDVINGVLKLIAEHEKWCKNKHCDLYCAHADIRARAYLIDDYERIDDAIKNRGDEIINEYEKMKQNQSKLMQSIKPSNIKSNLRNADKPLENDSLVKTFSDTINVQTNVIPNLISPMNVLPNLKSPMNPRNTSSISPIQKPQNKKNPTQKHSTTKSSHINNENVSPISDNESIMKLLRHISALENLLGSLGPRSTELLKKTYQLYKDNSYYSPSSDDILLLETIREKLVGLLEINVLTSKEIPAVKQVLIEIKKYIKDYEEHSVTLET